MVAIRDLPAINAALNGTCAVLLVWGYTLIRRGKVAIHRKVMISAFVVSCIFLACYLTYHFNVGSVPFQGQGPIRVVYFSILLTHTVLAATVPILAGLSLWRGLTGNYDRHRRVARWTLPIWLYVSVTGVIIYWMLYRIG